MHEELKQDMEVATDTAQKKNQLMQFNSGITTIDFYSKHGEESIRENVAALLDKDIHNYTERAEKDFNDFLERTALSEYTHKCKQRISSQAKLSESEKQVFASFFTTQKLVDQTREKRKNALKGVELNIPKLKNLLSGDEWYTIAWKSIVNAGKKAKYWVEKNFGSIKENLVDYPSWNF